MPKSHYCDAPPARAPFDLARRVTTLTAEVNALQRTIEALTAVISATKTPTSDRLLTMKETCIRLTISRTTLHRNKTLRDAIPVVQITPTSVRFRERDVQAFIDRRTDRLSVAALLHAKRTKEHKR
jgi:predicted DNA-binding transcriptional regulator AlpA